MIARSPTKVEIAKALGVSRAAVSQVLNQVPNARISQSIRRRIIEEARGRGYRDVPRRRAVAATSAIAYIYCDYHNQYVQSVSTTWPLIIHEMQALAGADNRHMVFVGGRTDAESIQSTLYQLDLIRPLGVVLDCIIPEALTAGLRQRGIPYVVHGNGAFALDEGELTETNTVCDDCVDTLGRMMQWLHQRGCRRIALSIGDLRLLVHSMIFDAYRKWIDRLCLEYDPALVHIGQDAIGSKIIASLGRLGVQYDGIILGSLSQAIRALPLLPPLDRQHHRMRSICVYGAPDIPMDWLSEMAVVGPKCRDMARALYDVICAEVNHQAKKKKHVIVPASITEAIY